METCARRSVDAAAVRRGGGSVKIERSEREKVMGTMRDWYSPVLSLSVSGGATPRADYALFGRADRPGLAIRPSGPDVSVTQQHPVVY